MIRRHSPMLVAVGCMLASIGANGGEPARVYLSPSQDADYWQARYTLDSPATVLAFERPSGGRRLERVIVADDAFTLERRDEQETLRRKDSQPFRSVTVLEPTSIENPLVGYLPFARFGDGGLLLYTGRFHACAEQCSQETDVHFDITIDPGDSGAMVLAGKRTPGPYTLRDVGDGTKIYIGAGTIVDSERLLTIIDRAMPDEVVTHLEHALPSLMDYFEQHLGVRPKQTLFASFNVPGDVTGSSIKGGTLPGQIFMHFEGAKVTSLASEPDFRSFLAWFFAHEAAHVFQQYRAASHERSESWIHEGGADAMAYLALRDLEHAPTQYLAERVAKAKASCADALEGGPLSTALERGQPFQAFYDCGLVLHLAVDGAWRRAGKGTLYDAWGEFLDAIDEGADWSTQTYRGVVTAAGEHEVSSLIEAVVTQQLEDPLKALGAGGSMPQD